MAGLSGHRGAAPRGAPVALALGVPQHSLRSSRARRRFRDQKVLPVEGPPARASCLAVGPQPAATAHGPTPARPRAPDLPPDRRPRPETMGQGTVVGDAIHEGLLAALAPEGRECTPDRKGDLLQQVVAFGRVALIERAEAAHRSTVRPQQLLEAPVSGAHGCVSCESRRHWNGGRAWRVSEHADRREAAEEGDRRDERVNHPA